jgi:hypothetical protein
MSGSRKRKPEKTGTRRQGATASRLSLQFDLSADQPPRVVEETRRASEFREDIITRFQNEWQACRSQLPERPPPVGQVTVDIHLTKRPGRLSQAEGLLLLNELAAGVRPIFRGEAAGPPPIDLPFARGGLTFHPAPASASVLAKDADAGQDAEEATQDDNGLSVVDDVPAGEEAPATPCTAKPPALQEEEITSGATAAEPLQAELVTRLRQLIPTLPPGPEEKVKAVLSLHRDLNQTFWHELRDELVPLIKPLLQDIPDDYEGKRVRASLVNSLLSIFNLAILIQDDQGRTHRCSLYAVHARESDEKGNLRLQERKASGSSRRSYPIPSLGQIQLIEVPQQETELQPPAAQPGRRR